MLKGWDMIIARIPSSVGDIKGTDIRDSIPRCFKVTASVRCLAHPLGQSYEDGYADLTFQI